MKYLCKKTYSKEIIVGKYYEGETLSNDGFVLINDYWFLDFPEITSSNLNIFFENTSEIRRKKLKLLE